MTRILFLGFVLALVAAGCSASSSGKKGGTGGGYNTGGSGNVGIGGSGVGGSSIGGSSFGGTGGGVPPTGGTGGVATGGTGNTGSGGAAPSLVPTCTGVTTTSGGSCYPATPCNPMTNAGCTTAGAACDIGASGFQCYDPPNDVAICGACGDGAFCQPGNVCVDSQCLHYCCADTDCGSGKCYEIPLQDVTVTVKACLDVAPG